jgi:hypothetical protein
VIRKFTLAIAAGALLGSACRHAATTHGVSPNASLGAFDYRATIGRYELRGIMFVLPDTIIIKPEEQYCEPRMGPADQQVIRYDCRGTQDLESVVFEINRRNPQLDSHWMATLTERKTRSVCVRYTINANGQQVCAQYRTEGYDARSRQSGVIRTKRTVGNG